MEDLQLLDYLAILNRRKNAFFGVAFAVFALALFFALNWSNYRSTATVEIAQADIPNSIAAPAGLNAEPMLETMADLRVSRLQQKVLSTGSLVEIITKFNLYPEARRSAPITEIADNMLGKIKIDLVSSALANPASAQKAQANQLAAIAFTLSFDYKNALLTQQVTNELVTRFLDEDLKERRNQAKETANFLDAQLKIMEESLREQEKKIADFRKENGDTNPESLAFNQQANISAQMSLQALDTQINTAQGMIGTLRGQLAGVDPYSRVMAEGQLLTTPTIQLKTLKSNYASLSAKYGAAHPDVLKAKRQIEALETGTGAGETTNESAAIQATLTDVRARLETAEKTYGPANPEVVSLKNQEAKLARQLQTARTEDGEADLIKKDADNPAYLQIVAQLQATENQYKGLLRQRAEVQAQQSKFQRAVIQNPAVEQKLAELTRDYDNARIVYRDLKAKKLAADMASTIDEDRNGQRLVIVNPPELPIKTSPSRIVFLLAGTLLSLMAGLGAVIGLQIFSQSIVGSRHLTKLVGVAPLVTIPHLTTARERTENAKKRLRLILGGAVGFIALLTIISATIMPLDVMLFVLQRRIGLS